LQHQTFSDCLTAWLAKGKSLSKEEIMYIMCQGNEKMAVGSDKTRERRASTVKGWIEWILRLPMTMV